MEIKVIGVIGAGVMGAGVAQTFSQAGYKVTLLDISEEILQRASREIKNSVRFQGLFKKGEKTAPPGDVMSRITFSVDYESLRDTDFVIENATEKWEIKKGIYARIDEICHDDCIFAANTSAISITRLASLTRRAAKVVGIHFMNPVPMKPTVEMIRGYHTSDETIEIAKGLLAAVGKDAIVVNDSPGFVSNRVLMLTINEAIMLVEEQVASAEEVDQIFKKCFNHKMGPLETADLIGLDTILLSLEVL
ncbi:MAG TPA: 3-hydroxyacyl-CoA dehydrogenase family protein, partial [Blastocatellia bacterium]